jgi:hypothetical protein
LYQAITESNAKILYRGTSVESYHDPRSGPAIKLVIAVRHGRGGTIAAGRRFAMDEEGCTLLVPPSKAAPLLDQKDAGDPMALRE